MPRRGENIYKRKDGRWEGRYIKSRVPDGKAKYGYIYADTYKKVKDKLRGIIQNESFSQKGIISDSYSVLLNKWLQAKRIAVKESSLTRYIRIVEAYINPSLGSLIISDLNCSMLEKFIHELLTSGKKNGKGGLSPKTVSDILVVIKSSLEYGRSNGYQVDCNVSQISIKKKDKEMRVLTLSEQDTLTAFLKNNTDLYEFGVLLSLYTGIRLGELCALRWENIRFDMNFIRINETLQRITAIGESAKTRIIITEPKSACSVREIPIPKCLIPTIIRFQASPKAFVLTGDTNRYSEPRIMQYHFHEYIKKCGIAHANYHSLRHTFATRCIEKGFDIKSLSEILGHSNVNITLNRYVHSSFELKVENMNKLSF